MKRLSGKKVRVTGLVGSVGLGTIDGNRLYGPGSATVPIELADALGRGYDKADIIEPDEVKAEEVNALQNNADDGGEDGPTKYTCKLGGNTLSLAATEPTEDFPKDEAAISGMSVGELESEVAYRNIDLPDGKGTGSSGNYVKADLVAVLVATTPKEG